jgi:hypothetical protein
MMGKLDLMLDMMHLAIVDGHDEFVVLAVDHGTKNNLMQKIEDGLWARGWLVEKRLDELRVVGKTRISFVVPPDHQS